MIFFMLADMSILYCRMRNYTMVLVHGMRLESDWVKNMMRLRRSSQTLIGKSGSVFLFKLAQMSENFSQDHVVYIVSCILYTCAFDSKLILDNITI